MLALLPLRVFLGVTFVYAGIDKLIHPSFLQATGPGSIGAQLDAFVKVSPIGPLVHLFGQPFPVAIGLLIAVAEIAVGLGALSGLLFRLSAAGGFALSILFWLTASWATKPYYYGPDLPYALGWLTLALAGPLVASRSRHGCPEGSMTQGTRSLPPRSGASPSRPGFSASRLWPLPDWPGSWGRRYSDGKRVASET